MEELIDNFNIIKNYSDKIDKELSIKKNNSVNINSYHNNIITSSPYIEIDLDEEIRDKILEKINEYDYMNNIEITDYWNTFYQKSGLNNGICSISAFKSDRVYGFDLKIKFHNGKNLMVSIPNDSFSVEFVCKKIASTANLIYGTCCGG